jgi:hypothetical protein
VTHPLLERRRRERSARIAAARVWAESLVSRIELVAVVVFGSTARGDFNKWSDTDVLVIARSLPADPRERLRVLMQDAPPGLEPVAWTVDEFVDRRRRGDPIARECDSVGVLLFGGVPPHMPLATYPLLIEFVAGTRITREPALASKLPILRNGPPGTSVVFRDGEQVPVPTDQIVFADDARGAAHVAFGGMSFTGIDDGQLVFLRVRDLQPEELLAPDRGRRMTLEPRMVASIAVDGLVVWPT